MKVIINDEEYDVEPGSFSFTPSHVPTNSRGVRDASMGTPATVSFVCPRITKAMREEWKERYFGKCVIRFNYNGKEHVGDRLALVSSPVDRVMVWQK